MAMVSPTSPTLKRAKRRTEIFSPSLPTFAGDQLVNADAGLFHKRLIQQADFFVKLCHLAFHDFLHHGSRLAGCGGLCAIDFFFLLKSFRRHIFLADKLRVRGGNVHRNVFDQVFEVVGAGHKIALAIHFHQHANLSACVNVAGNGAFAWSCAWLSWRPWQCRVCAAQSWLLQGRPWLRSGPSCNPSWERRCARVVLLPGRLRCSLFHVLMKINFLVLKGPYNIRPAWLLPARAEETKFKFETDGQLSCASGKLVGFCCHVCRSFRCGLGCLRSFTDLATQHFFHIQLFLFHQIGRIRSVCSG